MWPPRSLADVSEHARRPSERLLTNALVTLRIADCEHNFAMSETVRIGCWAGFWGDSPQAAGEVLAVGDLQYLVADYLAEITMALLARARVKDPSVGFIPDALTSLSAVLGELHEQSIKVVTNAGALNPTALAAALREVADSRGLPFRIASVEGDDLLSSADAILAAGARDMFDRTPVPSELSTLNAYLGAMPIARALDAGADIVITGRCADAAVVLGPLIHEFGWSDSDYDLLSAGSLIGHIVECGPQCTGGNHTDWWAVPGWENIGFPVAECLADGTAIITKPEGSGGLVSVASVGEQILYEIGDPGAYIMPDVVCDWRNVVLDQVGRDRVLVSGARGSSPTSTYKVTATHAAGFRSMATAMFAGLDASGRARHAGESIVARTARLLDQAGLAPLAGASVEVIGAGDTLGTPSQPDTALEAVVKIGLRHETREALEIFSREYASLSLVAQGMTGFFAGRPKVGPVFELFHLLVPKSSVPIEIRLEAERIEVRVNPGDARARVRTDPIAERDVSHVTGDLTVPLRRIAFGRSGDKGNKANIGLIARRPEFLAVIREQVSARRAAAFFDHYLGGDVERWELPGLAAVNLVFDDVLGGRGGNSSLRFDPQGKSFAAMLLSMPVRVPSAWDRDGLLAR